jgi:hypothetical protein
MPKVRNLTLVNSNPPQIQSNYNFDKYRDYKLGFMNGPTIMKFFTDKENIIKNLIINDNYSNMMQGNIGFSYYNNNFQSPDQNLVDDYNQFKDIVISTNH